MKSWLLCVAPLVLVVSCEKGTESGMPHSSLGLLQPGGEIHTVIRATNPFPETARLVGLDKACSVTIVAPNNGILAPGKSIDLEIRGRAPRIPGPGAALVDLSIKAGDKEVPLRHQLDYVVAAKPYADRTEAWIAEGKAQIKILGKADKDVLECTASKGLECQVADSHIDISAKEGWTAPGHVQVKIGAESFTIPVFADTMDNAVRLYPRVAWAPRGKAATMRLVGRIEGVEARAADPRARVSVDAKTGTIQVKSGDAMSTEIVVSSGGREVCRGTFHSE